jgi:DNA-directed RNA polymerase specialized sigma24 family protein
MLNDLQLQQRGWLVDSYRGLYTVAAAITHNPEIAADVTSMAVVSALMQIDRGTCLASERARFFAWVRTIVRNRAKTVIGAGKNRRSLCRGDVMADLHAENIQAKYAQPTTEEFIDHSED